MQFFGGDVCLEHLISTLFIKPMKFEAAEHRCAAKCRGHGTAKVQP